MQGWKRVAAIIIALLIALSLAVPVMSQDKADEKGDNLISRLQTEQRTQPRILSRSLDISLSADGSVLYMKGPLAQGSYFKFAQKLRSAPKVKTVYLASEGGLLTEGFLIGNLVRKQGLNSYVGHYCASSCTLIYAAGKRRGLAPDARLGFHQAFFIAPDGTVVADPEGLAFARSTFLSGQVTLRPAAGAVLGLTGNERMAQLYGRAGIKPDFIAKVLDTVPEDMWIPPQAELATAGIFNAPDFPAIAPPAGKLFTRAEIDGRLSGSELWRQLQITRPGTFAETSEELWLMANTGMDIAPMEAAAKFNIAEQIESDVGQLPDALLDKYALYMARVGQATRAAGYPDCNPETDPLAADTLTLQFGAEYDALLAEILRTPERLPPLAPNVAQKMFDKRVGKLWKSGHLTAGVGENMEDERESCIAAMQMFEAIASLKPKDRLEAFRAMFFLPDE